MLYLNYVVIVVETVLIAATVLAVVIETVNYIL